jgi:L-arabinose transport system ATP-binding protein
MNQPPQHDAARPSATPIFRAQGISKGFPNVQALDDVSLDIYPGEVLALIGENGAGKSTLLRILNGDYQPDAGAMLLAGEPVSFPSPRAAHDAGVRVIYQEPEIIPTVSVAENIYVGELPRRGRMVDWKRLHTETYDRLCEFGFGDEIAPTMLAEELSPAQRQLVEIIKALKAGVKILALDEPTSSLSEEEAQRLFAIVRQLCASGVAIIYVSHRLREIVRLADRVAVLRDGKLVATVPATDAREDELVRLMVGRELTAVFGTKTHTFGDVALEARNLCAPGLHDISFQVRRGEVVGFAGLIGAGRTELAKALFGSTPITSGEIRVTGKPVTLRSPADAMAAGIGFTAEDRKREALFPILSVRENVSLCVLKQLTRWRLVNRRQEAKMVSEHVERLKVKTPDLNQEVGKLSGGNQQKVVLARWLAREPQILILDEPTRGIDVGAKAEIYQLIRKLAAGGLAIIFISSELPEVLGVSDRILVMQAGRITGELPAAQATEEAVLRLAMVDHLQVRQSCDER